MSKKKSQRPNHEGYYYRDEKGLFCWRVSINSVRITRKATTQKALKEKVNSFLDEFAQTTAAPSKAKDSVASYLAEYVEVTRQARAFSTYRQYEQLSRLYLIPRIGKIELRSLTAHHIQNAFSDMTAQGLSPQTVTLTRNLLRAALNKARSEGKVRINAAEIAEPPRVPRKETRALSPDQVGDVIGAALETYHLKTRDETSITHRNGPLIAIMLLCGLRISEAIALEWADLDHGKISIRRRIEFPEGEPWKRAELKTFGSRRNIPLNTIAISAIELQREKQASDRARAGGYYSDHGLIFATATGEPVSPSNVQRSLSIILVALGLPHFSLHDLRRSCATALALSGVPVTVVQRLLGHESAATTQKHYIRAFESDLFEAGEVLEKLFSKKSTGRP